MGYKISIGDRVNMTTSMAKFYIDKGHQIHTIPSRGVLDKDYHKTAQLALLCLMGESVEGTVIGHGSMFDTYRIRWDFLNYEHYYEYKKDFKLKKDVKDDKIKRRL